MALVEGAVGDRAGHEERAPLELEGLLQLLLRHGLPHHHAQGGVCFIRNARHIVDTTALAASLQELLNTVS